jgi:beta-lactamase class A
MTVRGLAAAVLAVGALTACSGDAPSAPARSTTTISSTTTTVIDAVEAPRVPTVEELGSSWRAGCPVGPSELRVLTIPYIDFEGRSQEGELVVAARLAPVVERAFAQLRREGFRIARMEPVAEFGGDDDASMAADNTSGFNCRPVAGTTRWSDHAYGTAIDINPVENPYVQRGRIDPPAGAAFVDRTNVRTGMLVDGGPAVSAFDAIGWEWGGRWNQPDHQHVAAPPLPSSDQALAGVVDRAVADRPVPFRLVVARLPDGEVHRRLADEQVLAASLYKLFVADELLRRVGAGRLDPKAAMEGGRTVEQCIEAMIVVSDNRCGVAGLDLIGRGRHDAVLRSQGYTRTNLDTPQRTSADDVALFLRRAHEQGGALWDLLARQQVRDRLPLGLPTGTKIAHKTGDRTHWGHDAGVITTPGGDVLVVVLTGPWDASCCDAERPDAAERRAFALIGDVARLVFDALAAP